MLYLYNTLTKKKEQLQPIKKGKINMFVCGPTVYDKPHLGHARTYIVFDFLVRYLRYLKYEVKYLQNITDIDDKIIKRAKEENVPRKKIAEKFEKVYKNEMKRLKIRSVSKFAKATNYIKEIISQIKRLFEKGYAYRLEDGIYFDVSKFQDYGKLAKRTVQQAEDSISRIDEGVNKKNKGDFCLWKFSTSEDDKTSRWKSPWGEGRPGWHIEDTAITEKEFGPQYDIHGGALDLIFPHHEAEIAQMEAISNKKPMVRYWLHTGLLTINGRKMSKSLGNFITTEKMKPEFLRFLFFSTHYQKPIDYNEKIVQHAKISQNNITEFIFNCKQTAEKISKKSNILNEEIKKIVNDAKIKFFEALNDNFNTPEALAQIFILINKLELQKMTAKDCKYCLKFLYEIDKIFQIFPKPKLLTNKIKNLIKQHEKYRKEKDYAKSDKIRSQLKELGFVLQDNPDGTTTIRFIAL